MNYTVYVLYSRVFDKFYNGMTQDLEERLRKHNNGLVTSTKRYIPWVVFAKKQCSERSDAYKLERAIKSKKDRKTMQNLLLKNQFEIFEIQNGASPMPKN
jgi:putative endonuclease